MRVSAEWLIPAEETISNTLRIQAINQRTYKTRAPVLIFAYASGRPNIFHSDLSRVAATPVTYLRHPAPVEPAINPGAGRWQGAVNFSAVLGCSTTDCICSLDSIHLVSGWCICWNGFAFSRDRLRRPFRFVRTCVRAAPSNTIGSRTATRPVQPWTGGEVLRRRDNSRGRSAAGPQVPPEAG